MPRVSSRELWRAYRLCGLGARLHVVVRNLLCPMDRVAAAAPLRGRCLDIGCGHGLLAFYLTVGEAERSVLAIDVSPDKVAAARKTRLPAGRVEFRCEDYAAVKEGGFDVIALVDVLYLVPEDVQQLMIGWSWAHLAAGGILLIKEIAERPRWKYWLNYVEETMAVKLLGITSGRSFHFRSAESLKGELEGAGFAVAVEPLDRGYLHPHVLFVARKGPR
jgi:2-polyprenyl-3-methyl-5-hydroxy-6-metoxy-1,4-benzoquinol methylase